MAAAIERIEPGQNEREVRIWLRDASFDAMIAWLATLVNDYGLTSRQLSINQSSQQASGLVNVRIDLAES
jgi:type II secretory pathway component PulM